MTGFDVFKNTWAGNAEETFLFLEAFILLTNA